LVGFELCQKISILMHMKYSVIIPLYNKKDYILRAINSVLSQAILPGEIIVINDGSTDTNDFSFINFNSLIKVIHIDNHGVSYARNLGAKIAVCEYLFFLDADDYWISNHVTEIQYLIQNSFQAEFFSSGSTKGIKTVTNYTDNSYFIDQDFINEFVNNKNVINSSSFCISKELFDKSNGYPVGITKGEDIIFWLELSKLSKFSFSKKITSIYDINSLNRSERHQLFDVPPSFIYIITQYNINKDIRYKKLYKRLLLPTLAGYVSNNCISDAKALLNYSLFHFKFPTLFYYLIVFIPSNILKFIRLIKNS